MLVLSRKRSEMIQIGDEILVKVIRTGRNTVKIGIDAPSHIRVLRGELLVDSTPAATGDTLDLDDAEEDSEPCHMLVGTSHKYLQRQLA